MPKNAYFLEKKSYNNRRSVEGSAPEPPLASGGRPQRCDSCLGYSFAECVSKTKSISLLSEKSQQQMFCI